MQPYGVGSSIAGKMNLPVVHVGYRDAFAFCVWANKRLPTETEWEHIARAEFNGSYYFSLLQIIILLLFNGVSILTREGTM